MNSKARAIAAIEQMPDDVTLVQIVSELRTKVRDVLEDGEEGLTPQEWEEDWEEEINRRVAESDANPGRGVPAEEFMQRMREKYG